MNENDPIFQPLWIRNVRVKLRNIYFIGLKDVILGILMASDAMLKLLGVERWRRISLTVRFRDSGTHRRVSP